MIKAKTVAYIRTSEEPVFVISITDTGGGVKMANVRRAVMSDSGIYHEEGEFYVEELQTKEEREQELLKDTEKLFGQFRSGNGTTDVQTTLS